MRFDELESVQIASCTYKQTTLSDALKYFGVGYAFFLLLPDDAEPILLDSVWPQEPQCTDPGTLYCAKDCYGVVLQSLPSDTVIYLICLF